LRRIHLNRSCGHSTIRAKPRQVGKSTRILTRTWKGAAEPRVLLGDKTLLFLEHAKRGTAEEPSGRFSKIYCPNRREEPPAHLQFSQEGGPRA
jgi:hypothetical protein